MQKILLDIAKYLGCNEDELVSEIKDLLRNSNEEEVLEFIEE